MPIHGRCEHQLRRPAQRSFRNSARSKQFPFRRWRLRGYRLNGTAISSFGHFCAEVPKSLHIGAYPRVFARDLSSFPDHESPANGPDLGPKLPDDLANCHAEDRGFESLQPLRFESPASGLLAFPVGKSNHPRISPPFWALVPKMTPMRGDFGRFPPRFRRTAELRSARRHEKSAPTRWSAAGPAPKTRFDASKRTRRCPHRGGTKVNFGALPRGGCRGDRILLVKRPISALRSRNGRYIRRVKSTTNTESEV
jgi:hypothetical protein